MRTRTMMSARSALRPRLMIVADLPAGFYALGVDEQRRQLDATLEEARATVVNHLDHERVGA